MHLIQYKVQAHNVKESNSSMMVVVKSLVFYVQCISFSCTMDEWFVNFVKISLTIKIHSI